ncbi:unnamed protein product, partial [Meganyctiphanes norvegica]
MAGVLGLGPTSCLTGTVQAGVLGSLSAMFYSRCNSDVQLCCTTSVRLTFRGGNQSTVRTSPQISQKWMDLLSNLNLLLIPEIETTEGRKYYYKKRFGNRDVIAEEITPIDCSTYNTLQVAIIVMFMATLPSIFSGCIQPRLTG